MADGNLEIKVSLEASVHKAMKEVVETVFRDHGLVIRSVDISWIGGGTGSGEWKMVEEIRLQTEMTHRGDVIRANRLDSNG